MVFKEILKDVVESVEGGIGAVIMGYDGIPIDEYVKDVAPFDIQLLAVEYTSVLKEVRRTIELLNTGEMEEISIITGLSRVIARAINSEFFVVLVLDSDGNYGKGRYLLKRDVVKLRDELR